MECKNCNSKLCNKISESEDYILYQCPDCSFYFKDTSEYDYDTLSESNYLVYNYDRKKEAIEINNIIKTYFSKAKILEIGCGTGSLLNELKNIGYKVIGVEPNKTAVEICYKSFPDLNVIHSYFRANLVPNDVNIIILHEVIEHLEPCNDLFSEIVNFMKKENLLIIRSGDALSFNAQLCFPNWGYIRSKEHISFYSMNAINIFCRNHGLVVQKFFRFRHSFGGIHLYLIFKNIVKSLFIKYSIDKWLNRTFTISKANDHFIAVIKKLYE